MSSHGPLGVKLTAAFLLASAFGSILVAYYYLIVLSRIIPISILNDLELFIFYDPEFPELFIFFINIYPIFYAFDYLAESWSLTAQLIFYPLLSVMFIGVAVLHLRMRNWARIITIIYAVSNLVTLFLYPLSLGSHGGLLANNIGGFIYPLFNPNIFFVLFFNIPSEFISIPYDLYFFIVPCFILPYVDWNLADFIIRYTILIVLVWRPPIELGNLLKLLAVLVSIFSGIVIPIYLSSDVKYKFEGVTKQTAETIRDQIFSQRDENLSGFGRIIKEAWKRDEERRKSST